MIVRRGLPVISGALVLLGLELATGVVGDAMGMLGGVARALSAGDPPAGIHLAAFVAGTMALATGLAGLAAWAWSGLTAYRIERGAACPDCGSGTQRIRRKRRQRFLAVLLGEKIQRRICPECGWKGLTLPGRAGTP